MVTDEETPPSSLQDETVTPTAQALVSAARRHLGMDLAFVAEFAGGRRIFRFIDAVPGAVRLEAGDSHELADTYCEQIVTGALPAVIPDTKAEPGTRDLAVTDQLGIASYVGVPVRYSDGRLFGTLCCLAHTTHGDLGDEAGRYLAVLAETIATELERKSSEPARRRVSRERIERVIAEQLFFPVFQPIVELGTGRVVGAEALTRFTGDERGPLAWFAEAGTVGLGVELELAAARAALTAFGPGRQGYLALNVSPSALNGLLEVVDGCSVDPARIVVELTEHAAVAEYSELQETTERLRKNSLRLAIDDTGAGISSLRHILETGPDIIKLDLSLTAGIDTDPVRQALAHALADFADRIGATVIAEGIETADQMRTVSELGIAFGQGFHIGHPEPEPPPDG